MPRARWWTALITILLLIGCGGSERGKLRLLIVGIDGADWSTIRPLLSQGDLPHVRDMIRDGAHGPLWSIRPLSSPLAWTTIATGRDPAAHRILSPDAAAEGRHRGCRAFWDILSDQGISCDVIGWSATCPAESIAGVMVAGADPETPCPRWIHPREREAEIRGLLGQPLDAPGEVDPELRDTFQRMRDRASIARYLMEEDPPAVLAIGFQGLAAAARVGKLEDAYRYQDRLLGELLAGIDPETTVMVLSGHGLEIDPEPAARIEGVLLMQGPPVRRREKESDPAAVHGQATLFDITPTILALTGLGASEDMEGEVLTEMLVSGFAPPARVRSFEPDPSPEAPPFTSDERRLLADYYLSRRQYERAADHLRVLCQEMPDSTGPFNQLGVVYMQFEDYNNARRMFEHVLEIDPRQLQARMNLAFVLRELRLTPRAAELLEEGVVQRPHHAGMRVNLGMLYKEMDQLDASLACFEEAIRLNPDYHPAHVQAAMVYERKRNIPAAMEHWREALRIRPGDDQARRRLERLERGLGGE